MNENLINTLGAFLALGVLIGVAYVLDRRRKFRGEETDKGDRIVFYSSVGLFVGGVLILGVGALYGSLPVVTIGALAVFTAWALRWMWRVRKIS